MCLRRRTRPTTGHCCQQSVAADRISLKVYLVNPRDDFDSGILIEQWRQPLTAYDVGDLRVHKCSNVATARTGLSSRCVRTAWFCAAGADEG
jgi:hypothetical protein